MEKILSRYIHEFNSFIELIFGFWKISGNLIKFYFVAKDFLMYLEYFVGDESKNDISFVGWALVFAVISTSQIMILHQFTFSFYPPNIQAAI